MLPSVKTLDRAFPGKGKQLRKALEANRAELALHPAGAARIAECLHSPKTYDVRMHVLDSIAETHGVEYINHRDDTFTQAQGLDYLNTGDTYALTIIRNCATGRYRVASWGDIVERDRGFMF
jgi:hypothetical protein